MKSILCLGLFLLIFLISTTGDLYSKSIPEEEKLVRVGIGAFKDGFYDLAEKQFFSLIKDFPQYGKIHSVYYLLGKTLLLKGRLNESRTYFLKIFIEDKDFEFMDHVLFWLGTGEFKLGNAEEAKKYFLLLIKHFPKFEWIHFSYYLLGLIEFEANRFPSSESYFKKVSSVSKGPDLQSFAHFWLGILSYKRNDFETAISYLNPLKGNPRLISQDYLKYVLFWLAEAKFKLGKVEEAQSDYKAFLERFKTDPTVSAVTWRLGLCEYRLGNLQASMTLFQSFKNQFKESSLIFYTHYLLGEILRAKGDYPSSIKELNLILSQPRGNLFWGVSYLSLFWDYIHLGEMEEANRILQKLQKLNQFDEEKTVMQWVIAEMTFFEGRIGDALPYYFNIINSRLRERSLFQIGKGYFFETKFREAITNLDILILEFPNSEVIPEGLLIKGDCLTQLGNVDQALETFQAILRPDRKDVWELLALIQLGSLHRSRNETDRAEIELKRALQTFPDHPLCLHAAFQLGTLSFKKNNVGEAVSYYSMVLHGKVLELLGPVYFGFGEIFSQQGKDEKALNSFKTAVEYLKTDSIWFFLAQMEIGNLQRKFKKYEEAKKAYRMILDHSKDELIKRSATELLNHLESY